MAIDGKNVSAERDQTDESLRGEREKTDRVLVDRQAAIAEEADLVVQRARERADAVLTDARDKADQQLDETAPQVAMYPTVAENRELEDEALREERAAADESLRHERDEEARVLAGLLPMEREKTDRTLLTERIRSDVALTNRDDFLGIVSHDLRNLIGGIVMSAALLSKRAGIGNEARKETLVETERIQRYAVRMSRLIGDLVDIASIDNGKLAVIPARGDSSTLIAEALEMFQGVASAKRISLEAELVERPLPAEFDHDRMLQVLANLITNAIKFTAPGGRITVRGERIGDDVLFSISDTGSGIPSNMLEAIFERFWQVGKNDQRGLGLGLYISRCLVQAHGGKIWAESKLGEGSKLYFTLPDPRDR